jgi:toxin-antitoxin system PIN domain toxin
MRSLLDVNVLIALHDPDHTHNEAALTWWGKNGKHGWASCAISENGFIRISSSPGYSPNLRLTPLESATILDAFTHASDHEFWADSISLRDEAIFSLDLVVGSRQLTDLYLLALAVRNNARLVTFDRRIPLSAVIGATNDNIVVLSDR